jgi:hypothetical protein
MNIPSSCLMCISSSRLLRMGRGVTGGLSETLLMLSCCLMKEDIVVLELSEAGKLFMNKP